MASNYGYETQCQQEIRIMLLGKTGHGKSAFGNTICGSQKKKFPFTTGASSASVTTKSQCHYRTYRDRRLCVIDTPGFFDTNCSNDMIMKEIAKSFALASPGPHAFLIVLYGRCTAEEETVFSLLHQQFGPQVVDYCIIVVTHEDEVRGHDYESEDTKIIEKYFENAPLKLKDLLEKCSHRCILINNRAEFQERERKVELLIEMIKQIEQSHGNNHYNHEMFVQAERELHQWEIDELERQKQERQREIDQIHQEIRRANLPREEAIQREEKLIEEICQKEQQFQREIRDIRRFHLQNNENCDKIVRYLSLFSRLLPPPVLRIRWKR